MDVEICNVRWYLLSGVIGTISDSIRVYQNIAENIRDNQTISEIQEERDGESVNRLGFLVLSVLLTNDADNRMAAMSLKEIMQTEDLDVRENTLFKKLRDYEIQGYVQKGMKDGRANTFYITDAGKDFLEQNKR